MLKACLASLGAQIVPGNVQLFIVVVDNEAAPNNRAAVDAFAASCRFPVVYSHQPDPGIPQARNRVLDEAWRLGADWIAFIDDDEEAAVNWIAELLSAAERHNADVVQGRVFFAYPEPRPFWALGEGKYLANFEGEVLDKAETSNVLFSSQIISPDGLALRFSEDRRFTGGEDTHFFICAKRAGSRIVFAASAVVFETVPRSKVTFWSLVRRAEQSAANGAWLYLKDRGRLRAAVKFLPRAIEKLAVACLHFAAGLAYFPFNRRKAKKRLLTAGKRIMSSVGQIRSVLGFHPQPYKRVHGG
jgi:GT2 family glycosyltransferase